MVIDTFQHGNGAETHCLADCETGEHEGEGRADGVEEEGFGEGVVEGAEGVGNVDFVVVRVHVACSMLLYVDKGFWLVMGRHVRNIHLFECIALCQKYCQASLNMMAIPNRAAGSRTQYSVFAAYISHAV